MTSRYLITGALGCIGAWTILRLIKRGHFVVAADVGTDRSRLHLISAGTDVESSVVFARTDITDLESLGHLVSTHKVDRIIHLAALQVPASHANPPAGALVNVVGTTNVFEVARVQELESVVFASSVAVYGPELAASPGSIPNDADQNPNNFYGVFKRADEAVARLYHEHHGVASVGLRPHTVYGPGRDTGMTSAPTWAMLAAARGEDYEIPFSGRVGLQFAPDVAETFIRASNVAGSGETYSIKGAITSISQLADVINRRSAKRTVTVSGGQLPFPAELDDADLAGLLGGVPGTSLEEGVDATIGYFRAATPEMLPNP